MPCRVQFTRPVGLFLRVGTLTHGGMAIRVLALTNHKEIEMYRLYARSKVKLLLKQMGNVANDDELEYEVIETSDAMWACGEILCREDAIETCEKHNVRIIQGVEDE